MKKYISCCTWRDLTDRHLYHEGDQFPFDGREVKPERLAELESGVNRAGLKLIKADEAAEPEVQKAEAQPESEQETEPESEPEQEKDPEPEQEPEKPKQKPARKPANKK